MTWVSILVGFGFAMLIVYVPNLNSYFNFILAVFGCSGNLKPLFWVIPIIGGAYLLIYSGLRRLFLRKFNPTKWNPEIAGLQMHPTRWSTH